MPVQTHQAVSLQSCPQNLVIGDAACTFNPIYGQGMTVAALEAMGLRDGLRQWGDLSGLARRFQRRLARISASPWALATSTDILVPTVEGGSMKWTKKWQYYYFDRLVWLLPSNLSLTHQFIKVMHMVEPPTTLFSPSIALKVLFTRK